MIKKYYFINKLDTNNINKQDKQTTIIYRNYSSKKIDQTPVLKIKRYCKKKSIDFYLSNNVKLAIKLGLDGVYIPAFNNSLKHLAYSYKENFKLIGSAHNLKEIRAKENQNVSKIFLSSLFKKNKNYLWINKFKNFNKKYLPPESYVKYLNKRFSPYCSVATWYLWRSIDPEPIQY